MNHLTGKTNYPELPFDCPICGKKVVIDDIDEWDEVDGWLVPSELGLHISCESEPEVTSGMFNVWFGYHFAQPYADWLPLSEKVYKWIISNCRWYPKDQQEELEQLERWNKGLPMKVDL